LEQERAGLVAALVEQPDVAQVAAVYSVVETV